MRYRMAGALAAAAMVSVALIPSADATLLSYEAFSGYTAGDITTTTSPTVAGYTGNWTAVDFGTQHLAVSGTTLTYGGANYAGSTGGSVGAPTNTTGGEIVAANSGRVYRLLSSTLAVTSASTGSLYLSFLYQNGQETGATTYQMLGLGNGSTADANIAFSGGICNNAGQSGTAYNFGVNNAFTSTGVTSNTATHLFVVKFTLSATAAADSVTVWLDPTLGGTGDPSGGTSVTGQDIVFDRLILSDYDGNSVNFDELRWGTTFADVTAVPEPSTVAASVLGLALVAGCARRRRAAA